MQWKATFHFETCFGKATLGPTFTNIKHTLLKHLLNFVGLLTGINAMTGIAKRGKGGSDPWQDLFGGVDIMYRGQAKPTMEYLFHTVLILDACQVHVKTVRVPKRPCWTSYTVWCYHQHFWTWMYYCETQPSSIHWLSSPIFPCSFVRTSVPHR